MSKRQLIFVDKYLNPIEIIEAERVTVSEEKIKEIEKEIYEKFFKGDKDE